MEIERKYLVKEVPEFVRRYPNERIEQGYLCREPVVRVRAHGDKYTLTYKGDGLIARVEYNLPLTAEAYAHLIEKADGKVIRKTRYKIPYQSYVIELDFFDDIFIDSSEPLIMAEVEFDSLEEADGFSPPEWFGEDVSLDPRYHNSNMGNSSAFA